MCVFVCSFYAFYYRISSNKRWDSNKRHTFSQTDQNNMRRLFEIWPQSMRNYFKCIWNKYTNKETKKITSSSGVYKAIYHYGSYILLFGKII